MSIQQKGLSLITYYVIHLLGPTREEAESREYFLVAFSACK